MALSFEGCHFFSNRITFLPRFGKTKQCHPTLDPAESDRDLSHQDSLVPGEEGAEGEMLEYVTLLQISIGGDYRCPF